jgi:hypothetical protein
MEKNKKKIPNAQCEVCGKEFYAKPYFLKHGWGKYCSKKCKDKGQRRGKYVICAYCSEKVYKPFHELHRKSKTKTYFCNKSCQCAWKNKQRKGKGRSKLLKNLWRSWCNSSIRVCGTLGEGAHPSGLPAFFLKFLKFKKKKTRPTFFKRPSKKALYDLYWKKNYTQTEIARIFNATHASVKRWLNYYKISIKPRNLTCGRNPNSLKWLELGRTPEVEKKSAESRRIYTPEKLIQKIREFVERHGRIPTKNEFVNDPSCPDYVTYRDYFGTWNNAIKAAGYEPNERWFSPRDLYAKDGHLCKSISEIIIDDWLFESNILHTREESYPKGRYRCDFAVNNIFIEFFGLVNASNVASNYAEIIKKKREICQQYKIPLIELYEKDLYNLDQTLGGKLKIKLNQKVLF